jgi:catechol 2,3-dioxygenase
MMKGGMVFMRFNADHHGIALVGTMEGPSPNVELNHLAFEVATLDEVVLARNHLKKHGVAIDFEGRRRAGVQIAVEFRDPDGHRLEIYWGLDRVGPDGYIRPANEWKGARTLREAIADPVKGQDTTLKDPSVLDDAVAAARTRLSGGKSRFE